MAQTNSYSGTFRKKDGSDRQMRFVRMAELTEQQKSNTVLFPALLQIAKFICSRGLRLYMI